VARTRAFASLSGCLCPCAGLINNVLYVIVLSAALDLVGPGVPKGVVLLADVIPSFGTKLIAPYFIHVVPYSTRILTFVSLSAVGMLLVALTPDYTEGGSISTKLAGIVLASLSSGGGECIHHLFVNLSCNSHGVECAIRSDYSVQLAIATFFEELLTVSGGGCD
jgi:hypothetical protein